MGKQARLRAQRRLDREPREPGVLKVQFRLDYDDVYVVDRPSGAVLCRIEPVQGGIDMRDPGLLIDVDRQQAWQAAAKQALLDGSYDDVPGCDHVTFRHVSLD